MKMFDYRMLVAVLNDIFISLFHKLLLVAPFYLDERVRLYLFDYNKNNTQHTAHPTDLQ